MYDSCINIRKSLGLFYLVRYLLFSCILWNCFYSQIRSPSISLRLFCFTSPWMIRFWTVILYCILLFRLVSSVSFILIFIVVTLISVIIKAVLSLITIFISFTKDLFPSSHCEKRVSTFLEWCQRKNWLCLSFGKIIDECSNPKSPTMS